MQFRKRLLSSSVAVALGIGALWLAGGAATAASAAGLGAARHPVPRVGPMLAAPAPAHAPPGSIRGATKSYAYNWSGYAQYAPTNAKFTAVKAYWTVPTVNTSMSGDQYSSDWVGIGGYNDQTLVQDGTEADNINGTAVYDAWTEIIPASEVVIPNLAIHPGDQIEAITKETSANVWKMTVYDLTTGQSGGRTVTYNSSDGGPSSMASAEVIHERPEVGGSLSTLAATTNVTFDPGSYSKSAPSNSPTYKPILKAAADSTVYRIYMLNNADTAIIASPSAPDSDSDGFTVADGATAPPPPSS